MCCLSRSKAIRLYQDDGNSINPGSKTYATISLNPGRTKSCSREIFKRVFSVSSPRRAPRRLRGAPIRCRTGFCTINDMRISMEPRSEILPGGSNPSSSTLGDLVNTGYSTMEKYRNYEPGSMALATNL